MKRYRYILVFVPLALALAQTEAFEVSSVKPAAITAPSGNGLSFNGCSGGPGSRDPGQYVCRGVTLKTLLELAYDTQPSAISGPKWIDSERYDIIAKPPSGATKEQISGMLQSLLAEHFALKLQREVKSLPIYALLAPHGSAKLKPSPAPDQPEDPAAARAMGRSAAEKRKSWGPDVSANLIFDSRLSMAQLADLLAKRLDRPVKDLTGLAGTFSVELVYASGVPVAPAPDAPHPTSVFEALDELGLRLEARSSETEILTVQDALRNPR